MNIKQKKIAYQTKKNPKKAALQNKFIYIKTTSEENTK